MKKTIILYFVLFTILFGIQINRSVAQQGAAINTTGAAADPSAMLDVSGISGGVLINRMSETERNQLLNPAEGLLIYNTTTKCINMWTGTAWKQSCFECDFNNPIASNNGPICEGSDLNLYTIAIQGASYQWSGPGGFTSTEQNPVIVAAAVSEAGSYSVIASKDGCSSQPQTTFVTVNPIPATPLAGNDGPKCAGETLSLTAPSLLGGSYSWTGPNNFVSNLQNPIINNVQLADAGNYNVSVSANNCVSASGTTTVAVIAIPDMPGTVSSPAKVTSYSTGNVYSISPVSGATSYVWSVPATAAIMSGQSTTSITVSYTAATTDTISVSAINSCGNGIARKLVVTVEPTIVSFTDVGTTTWTPPTGVSSVEVLVVAGGGGGGGLWVGGGGGAGGLLYYGQESPRAGTSYSVSGPVTVTVGDGGQGGYDYQVGANGQNSVFGTLTAIGGGGGAAWNLAGTSGGSGGGGSMPSHPGGNNTTGQGYPGGAGGSNPNRGGGGGGAGASGNNAQPPVSGHGLTYSISGSAVTYAGGGGAVSDGGNGVGAAGGGGTPGTFPGCNGTDNLGGGGAGNGFAYSYGNYGGKGGSGVVIIKY